MSECPQHHQKRPSSIRGVIELESWKSMMENMIKFISASTTLMRTIQIKALEGQLSQDGMEKAQSDLFNLASMAGNPKKYTTISWGADNGRLPTGVEEVPYMPDSPENSIGGQSSLWGTSRATNEVPCLSNVEKSRYLVHSKAYPSHYTTAKPGEEENATFIYPPNDQAQSKDVGTPSSVVRKMDPVTEIVRPDGRVQCVRCNKIKPEKIDVSLYTDPLPQKKRSVYLTERGEGVKHDKSCMKSETSLRFVPSKREVKRTYSLRETATQDYQQPSQHKCACGVLESTQRMCDCATQKSKTNVCECGVGCSSEKLSVSSEELIEKVEKAQEEIEWLRNEMAKLRKAETGKKTPAARLYKEIMKDTFAGRLQDIKSKKGGILRSSTAQKTFINMASSNRVSLPGAKSQDALESSASYTSAIDNKSENVSAGTSTYAVDATEIVNDTRPLPPVSFTKRVRSKLPGTFMSPSRSVETNEYVPTGVRQWQTPDVAWTQGDERKDKMGELLAVIQRKETELSRLQDRKDKLMKNGIEREEVDVVPDSYRNFEYGFHSASTAGQLYYVQEEEEIEEPQRDEVLAGYQKYQQYEQCVPDQGWHGCIEFCEAPAPVNYSDPYNMYYGGM